MDSTLPEDAGLSTESTTVLVERARAKDARALSTLLHRYHPRVLNVVRRRIGPHLRTFLESGDVVQDVMIETIRSVPRYRPRRKASFLSWMSGIAENRIRNLVRSLGTRSPAANGGELDVQDPHPGCAETAEAELEERHDGELLAAGLRQLSEPHHEVIRLRHFCQLPFDEIGRKMGRSEDAVWMLHKRAKQELALAIEKLRRSDPPAGIPEAPGAC